jgi:hypothetical protein
MWGLYILVNGIDQPRHSSHGWRNLMTILHAQKGGCDATEKKAILGGDCDIRGEVAELYEGHPAIRLNHPALFATDAPNSLLRQSEHQRAGYLIE